MQILRSVAGVVIAGLILAFFNACDKIVPPYKKTQSAVATFPNSRNILLEEFTGHTCPNCPAAAQIVEGFIDSTFKGRVIPVAIHALSLADPIGAPFNYNFETSSGNEYASYFGISGDPSAMVNRKPYAGGSQSRPALLGSGSWGAAIQTFVNDTAAANIIISNSNYNPLIKQSAFSVSVNWLSNLKGTYSLCLEYTEDSIINAQIMGSGPFNLKYVFMHVLRGNLNGDWGQQIASNPSAYSVWSNNYTCTLDSALVPKNCHLVAYVFNNSTNEVIQAQQTNLLP